MTIKDVAERINDMSAGYRIGDLQKLRANLKSINKPFRKIFSGHGIKKDEGYAFHTGGRKEIQFNVGYEGDTGLFRYCLAFSLEKSQSLVDPIGILGPKVIRFNEYFEQNSDQFKDLFFWHYSKSKNGEFKRSANEPVSPIPQNRIRLGNFLVIGKYIEKTLDSLTDEDFHEVLSTFDRLLDVYIYVESGDTEANQVEKRIARICWNDEHWVKPSGWEGKSTNPKSFEAQRGFGHEEWLFDTAKIVEGYHYSFIQPINNNPKKYAGQSFDLGLYAILDKPRERWWLGQVHRAKVVSSDESNKVFRIYKARGWLKEMHQQLRDVRADADEFYNLESEAFFNLKFTQEDIDLLDKPLRFSKDDPAVTSNYISTLLYWVTDPVLESPSSGEFEFSPGHTPQKKKSQAEYGPRTAEINNLHSQMQTAIYRQLAEQFGVENVGTEIPTGHGSKVDLVVTQNGQHIFFEFKTSHTAKGCIREALAQIMEYAYWPNRKLANKLVIVSQNPINDQAKQYLNFLRTRFKMPVYYRRYDVEKERLEAEEY